MIDLTKETLEEWKREAELLEPHHEYKEAQPSRSGKSGVRCIFCDHYTNGMERGKYSACPQHFSKKFISLISAVLLISF